MVRKTNFTDSSSKKSSCNYNCALYSEWLHYFCFESSFVSIPLTLTSKGALRFPFRFLLAIHKVLHLNVSYCTSLACDCELVQFKAEQFNQSSTELFPLQRFVNPSGCSNSVRHIQHVSVDRLIQNFFTLRSNISDLRTNKLPPSIFCAVPRIVMFEHHSQTALVCCLISRSSFTSMIDNTSRSRVNGEVAWASAVLNCWASRYTKTCKLSSKTMYAGLKDYTCGRFNISQCFFATFSLRELFCIFRAQQFARSCYSRRKKTSSGVHNWGRKNKQKWKSFEIYTSSCAWKSIFRKAFKRLPLPSTLQLDVAVLG